MILILQLWDLRKREIVQEYRGHTEAVEACIFLPFPGKPLIATSSRDCTVRVWDQHTKGMKINMSSISGLVFIAGLWKHSTEIR